MPVLRDCACRRAGNAYAFAEDMTQCVEVFAVTVETLSGKARPASF